MNKNLFALLLIASVGWAVWSTWAPGPDDLAGSVKGGHSSFSPDQKWYVEVGDGQSRTHSQSYATLWIWSVEQSGKPRSIGPFQTGPSRNKAVAHFVFPQEFVARNSRWEWRPDSRSFTLIYELYGPAGGTGRFRHLQYDMETNTFALTEKPR